MDKAFIKSEFTKRFNSEPVLVKAPGRINLIGEHTDYNDGFVMPAAIDKQIVFGIAKATEDFSNVISLEYNQEAALNMEDCPVGAGLKWEQYFRGAIAELKSRNIVIPQRFNLMFGGNIPIGAGLSSSAALCCGFLFSLDALFELDLSRKEIALIAQATEHRIGLNCGIMDQYAVMFGEKQSFICLDCRSLDFQTYSTDFGDYEMVLINSKVEHELTESAYNDRRRACEEAVRVIGRDQDSVKNLRDVNMDMLRLYGAQLHPEIYKRARYIIEENARVQLAKAALEKNDIKALGNLLYQAHAGLSRDYEISTTEMDLLVDLTRDSPHIAGARMMGGGFGGCTINLIRKDHSETLLKRILELYKAETGIEAVSYHVQVNDGVNRI